MSSTTVQRLAKIDSLVKTLDRCIALHEMHAALPPADCRHRAFYAMIERDAADDLREKKQALLSERDALLAQREFAFA